jgi:hypothetical protein
LILGLIKSIQTQNGGSSNLGFLWGLKSGSYQQKTGP